MKISEIGELPLVSLIRERFRVRARDVLTGIGDDAAVIAPRREKLLVTTDMMTEGVHFDLHLTTFFQLGFKILSVNVSDVYAMGGTPRYAVLDLSVPPHTEYDDIESLFKGLEQGLNRYRVRLIGGDLSSSMGGVVISATVIGYARRPILRSGAQPDDRIYVTGTLGDAACGLALLEHMGKRVSLETGEKVSRPLRWQTMKRLIERHLMPEARRPGATARHATAMIDISDGLFIDLHRLCDESKVGCELFLERIPLSAEMKRAARWLELDLQMLATSGGEDYELLFTAPEKKRVNAFCIGKITDGERVLVDRDGNVRPLPARGYEHWR